MTESKNGIILVVIATIVTSILILTTTRESKAPSADRQVSEVVAVENETAQAEIIETNSENQQIQAVVDVKDQPVGSTTAVEEVTAPKTTVAQTLIAPTTAEKITLITPSAPTGPFSKITLDINQDKKLEDHTTINEIAATDTQHELLNHIIQPIWMDQKLGDFKSLEQDGVVFDMMPSSSDGLQGENPTQVVTSKSDKFAPTSISANYNYQQMPMYNGGYYIAPMPSYLMPSMLPGNSVINNKK